MKTTVLKFLLAFTSTQVCLGYMRVCYYTNWAQYRYQAKFYPENIPPELCTHIFYAFGEMANNVLSPREWNDPDSPWSEGMFSRINKLKQKNPDLKILLSIGGWISNDEAIRTYQFRYTANSPSNRAEFVSNTIKFLRDIEFDGLDIDWEYPRETDKHLELMMELRAAFDIEGKQTGRDPLLLAGAVWGNAVESEDRYDMAQLGKYMDFVGIMSYDYYGSWDPNVKQHSILYPDTDDVVNLWLFKGFPPEKLIIGIATYGRSFTLANSARNTPGSAAVAAGHSGQFTNNAGFLAYYEICLHLKQGWTAKWDNINQVPYAYFGNQWVGYDNKLSVALKADYVIKRKLGGVMIWTLDFDDFQNKCGHGTYPLCNVLKDKLPNDGGSSNAALTSSGSANVPADTKSETTTTTTTTSAYDGATTAKSNINDDGGVKSDSLDDLCLDKDDGLHPVLGDCGVFLHCVHTRTYKLNCPVGLVFDPATSVCNWPSLVNREDC